MDDAVGDREPDDEEEGVGDALDEPDAVVVAEEDWVRVAVPEADALDDVVGLADEEPEGEPDADAEEDPVGEPENEEEADEDVDEVLVAERDDELDPEAEAEWVEDAEGEADGLPL